MLAPACLTQVLRREQTELAELVGKAEALRTENASLHRRSMRLPGLQEENDRLKARWLCGTR